MTSSEKAKKLSTLPWQALHDFAIENEINENEISNKDKYEIINRILLRGDIDEKTIEQLVNDYIYGNRITFTLWVFDNALKEKEYSLLRELVNEKAFLDVNGFRNLYFISVKECEDRFEVLYVYSKEYSYIDEHGHDASVWEQHRGCLWIGLTATYLACISKHDKMTRFVTQFISRKIGTKLRQLKPPKKAIERCVNPTAISRIVLQGIGGEKTVVSRSGGLTKDQECEIERIRDVRFDTSGSYIADVAKDIEVTIKYNVKKGSIGIYKHLSSEVLFAWTKDAIEIILEEIKNLKGQPAESIFRELGQEIKWSELTSFEESQMNWFLTQVISALDQKDEFCISIPEENMSLLKNHNLFLELPRIYCEDCDSYEIPYCVNCDQPLKLTSSGTLECECGAPLKVKCHEGHRNYSLEPWYIPKKKFTTMINKNVKYIFPDEDLVYHICIMGDNLSIVHGNCENAQVEIYFNDIACFHTENTHYIPPENIKHFAIWLNEKCSGTCSKKKISKCMYDKSMVCLPKIFYPILPSYRPQPHKGNEYGDVSGEIKVGNHYYEMKGIIKKNSKNTANKQDEELLETYLLSTSKEGQEIIRQFVEQGMNDSRCDVVAIISPQYFDSSLKGTLRNLARLVNKKVVFMELDDICKLIEINETVETS